ncbi:MAG: glycosyltransferase family 4 protein [Candidatus Dojkabacteria bacterium]
MKIGIDLSPSEDSPAGVGQYTISIVSKLVEIDTKNTYFTYSKAPIFLPNTENIVIHRSRGLFSGVRWMRKVSSDAKKRGVELFISPSNHLFSLLFPKTVQFIHDLAPLKTPGFFKPKARILYPLTAKMALRRSWKVVTISQAVKDELLELKKVPSEKISVIYPALNLWIINRAKQQLETSSRYTLPDEFLLSVSTLEPRKNHINLMKGFAEFKSATGSKIKLVVVGKKGWYYKKIFSTVKELGIEDEVVFLGYVSNEDLASIYSKAAGFIYLSFYEGFGMPPIEAMYFNLPVLVSNIDLFHETLESHASFTNHNSPTEIADSIIELLKGSELTDSKKYVSDKYTGERSAEKLLKVISTFEKGN